MTKIRKGFFWTWGVATVLLALFAWWQTSRLASVSADREQIRHKTLSTLLTQAATLLDNAADQVRASNFGTAQSTAGAAIALFDAAAPVAEGEATEEVQTRSEQVTSIRASMNEGDPGKVAVEQLRTEAVRTRDILQKLTGKDTEGDTSGGPGGQ